MDFDLSEEQRLLKESLDRLIGDRYVFEQRKNYAQSPEGWSREMWAQFAELGLLGLPFEERHGGSAGGTVETDWLRGMCGMPEGRGTVMPQPAHPRHPTGRRLWH